MEMETDLQRMYEVQTCGKKGMQAEMENNL